MVKRILFFAVAALTLFACSGVDYGDLNSSSSGQAYGITPSSSSVDSTPSSSSLAAKIAFDELQYWIGEGENRAMLIIQWNDGKSPDALAYGYRWSGTKYGHDMIDDIAKTDKRFFYLRFSDPAFGYAIAGIGFDASGGNNVKLGKGGSCESPVDGSIDADSYFFDDWKVCEGDDTGIRFAAGWYSEGYWNYWVSDNISSKWEYSGLGASSRELKNNSVDAWYFDIHAFTGSELSTFPYCMEDPDNCDGKNYIGIIAPVSKPR